MAKFTLDTGGDDEIDFLLIGIVSHARGYKLCWSLNQLFHFHFINTNQPLKIENAKKKVSMSFDVFQFDDETTRVNYYLIHNKSLNGYLLPEFKHVDFLLMLKENLTIDVNEIIASIKQSDQVMTAMQINTEDVKSIENLVF